MYTKEQMTRAEALIGTLTRDGATVYYAFPPGGMYREGSRVDLILWLIYCGHAA